MIDAITTDTSSIGRLELDWGVCVSECQKVGYFRCGLGGYDRGFSLPWLGFESRHRNQEGMQLKEQIWGLKFCLRSSVGQQHSTVNREVAGSNPAANAFPLFQKVEQNPDCKFGSAFSQLWKTSWKRWIRSYSEMESFLLWEQEFRVRFPMRLHCSVTHSDKQEKTFLVYYNSSPKEQC